MNNLAIIENKHEQFESFVHISYNQVRTFLQCPQKYFYQYVRGMEWEFIPEYFPFGRAIHKAVEGFYRHIAEKGEKLPLDIFLELFKKTWKLALTEKIRFKENSEDLENMGIKLLECFHREAHPGRIIGVEIPFKVEMADRVTGETLPCQLVGIFDLIETDDDGNPVVVELKTGKKRFTEDQLDLDFQATLYGYALKQMGYSTTKDETLIRFDLLLKTKKPALEKSFTIRNAKHYLYDVENPKEVYFVVLTSTKMKPWLIRYYRNPQRIFNEVTRSSMFADYIKACETICKRIGWINWEGIRAILETSKKYFQEVAERKFTEDLITYLEYKQNEAVNLRKARSEIASQFALKLYPRFV